MSPEHPLDTHQISDKEPQLNKYFKAAIKTQANDIHLKVGQPPKLRLFGELKNTTGEILTAERMEELVFEIMTPAQKEFFLSNGTLDFAHEVGREHRFRINVFRQRGVISLVGRRVSAHVPSFESLHLPPILAKIAESRQGLVLVVGATGCGKTTTIAAMLDYITKTRSLPYRDRRGPHRVSVQRQQGHRFAERDRNRRAELRGRADVPDAAGPGRGLRRRNARLARR